MKTVLITGAILTIVLIVLLRAILKTTGDDLISRLADAIATAEGYFVTGSRAQRNNNPGNLKEDLTGKATGRDGPFVQYGSAADGWEALKTQVRKMFSGSRFYNPGMTIQEIANIYTATSQVEWARIVSNKLGVTANTKLEDV